MTLEITPTIGIGEGELEFEFVRASGPGGQNVNKVASAAQLRFDVMNSPSLPPPVKARLRRLAGRRLTRDGVLVLFGQTYRTQERNRQDVLERLVALVREAAVAPKRRRATAPSRAAKQRRLEAKRHRGAIKSRRQRSDDGE